MGSKKTGKDRKWEKEHSLLPTHFHHSCKECGRFRFEHIDFDGPIKNYCSAKMKRVSPQGKACSSFTLAFIITRDKKGKRKIQKTETVEVDLAIRMMQQKPPPIGRISPLKFPLSTLPHLKPSDKPREVSKNYAEEVTVFYEKAKSKKTKIKKVKK